MNEHHDAHRQFPKNPSNDSDLKKDFLEQNKIADLSVTNTVLKGLIAVGVFIIEGPTADLQMSDAEYDEIEAALQGAVDFIEQQCPYHLEMKLDISSRQITTPSCTIADRYSDDCEAAFRDPVLQSLGYSNGNKGIKEYVDALASNFQADGACVIFISNYKIFHYAYESGLKVIINPQMTHAAHQELDLTIIHEVLHLFGAADEYSPCSCSDKAGALQVPNRNCVSCTGPLAPCVMRTQDVYSICHWTRGQIGWNDEHLLIAYGNDGNHAELHYITFNGVDFSGHNNLTNANIKDSASLIYRQGQVYCFYINEHTDLISHKTFNKDTWNFNSIGVQSSIDAADCPGVVLDPVTNNIYAFYRSPHNNLLIMNTFDGTNFHTGSLVPNTGLSSKPAVVYLNGKIFCFHQGAANNGEFSYNIYNLHNTTVPFWDGNKVVKDSYLSSSPSAVVVGNRIFCFQQGRFNNGELWYNIYDDNSQSADKWVGVKKVDGIFMSGSPNAVLYRGVIHVYYEIGNDKGDLLFAKLDPNTLQWSAPEHVHIKMHQGPAVVVIDKPYG